MKLNFATIFCFALLLTIGFSTKSNAQHCGWHRYGYWGPEHACADHHSWHYGHYWGGYCTQEMRQRSIDDSISCAKYREDVKAARAKYEEGDAIMKNAHHGYWGHCSGHACSDHGCWGHGWWGWRWNRYYYRGAGY